MIGVTVMIIVMYSYRRDLKKPEPTETANFDFHYYSNQAWSMLEKIRHYIQHRQWTERSPRVVQDIDTMDRLSRMERTPSYGSISSANII